MADNLDFVLNSLSTFWSASISDPIKSIGAFASIGALIISWKNFRKDTTRIKVRVKRAQNGPLILQHPNGEFIAFEVYNQGLTSVVINEIGITVSRSLWSKKEFINLVDLPQSALIIRGQEDALGTLEYVGLPGTVSAKSLGIFLLDYSSMKAEFLSFSSQELSPESLNYFGSSRLIRTYQEFQKIQDCQGKHVQIIPYVLTGSGERFVGKKAYVKLGSLGDTVV